MHPNTLDGIDFAAMVLIFVGSMAAVGGWILVTIVGIVGGSLLLVFTSIMRGFFWKPRNEWIPDYVEKVSSEP